MQHVVLNMADKRLWTPDEFKLVLNLYFKLPFGKLHRSRPEVRELADLIGRTDNSVALRLVNFAACDPAIHQKGMTGGIDKCQPYFDAFVNDREKLAFESEQILARLQNTTIEQKYAGILDDVKDVKGEERERIVKTRVNQNYFRLMVLANYDGKCALTGIDIPELLLASHIIPWAKNKQERLNPCNGICLSALYDKAFDQGLMGFDSKYRAILSSRIKEKEGKEYYHEYFAPIEGRKLAIPAKYKPDTGFLEWHMDEVFQR